ncbi:zinc finger MYM-type protein 1-like [Limanda limanda]|uniref:zinc finger MYM-type protein 1-like n=1 Tax=Limanda limanda TaxID=27771 RepID=UPI0029C5FE4D|nr:zinc finger MYM-type protein 1-like [Limanda limanda]
MDEIKTEPVDFVQDFQEYLTQQTQNVNMISGSVCEDKESLKGSSTKEEMDEIKTEPVGFVQDFQEYLTQQTQNVNMISGSVSGEKESLEPFQAAAPRSEQNGLDPPSVEVTLAMEDGSDVQMDGLERTCDGKYKSMGLSHTTNNVDYLLKVRFSRLPLEEKLEIKRLGPHRPQDLVLLQPSGKMTRTFKREWFERKTWLTASTTKRALFCFPCLLFGDASFIDSVWATDGYKDLKHLTERTAKHESSKSHINCAIKLGLLGSVNRVAQQDSLYQQNILEHKQTEENRYVLGRLISCLKLCGKCELGLVCHDESADSVNPGMFRCIFEMMCEGDTRLKRHYDSEPMFKGTSSTIQNELLDCMYEVYRCELAKQLLNTRFVAVQVDEITDNACKSQMVIVLRYMVDNSVTERFLEFIEVKNKTATGLSTAIKHALEPMRLTEKLVAQTYDGTAVIRGSAGGVQKLMKQSYLKAIFVHCYAHQLNLTLQQACASRISELKVFFADLAGFATFFSTSPNRTAALAQTSDKRIPRPPGTRLNFESKTVNVVWERQEDILECLDNIRTHPGWDKESISEAYGLSMHLRDRTFLQLLEFFAKVMPEVDVLDCILQQRQIDASEVTRAVENFKVQVKEIRDRADEIGNQDSKEPGTAKRRQTNTPAVMKEACDTMIAQVEDRFSNIDHLLAAQLVDCSLFPKFVKSFPEAQLACAIKLWPRALMNEGKLQHELALLYGQPALHTGKSALLLFQAIRESHLQDVLSETCTLLRIIITTPMTSAEPERNLSTLKRIKTFTRNTMGHKRLNALSMLSIENEYVHGLVDFNSKVIVRFAQAKNRRANFLFK